MQGEASPEAVGSARVNAERCLVPAPLVLPLHSPDCTGEEKQEAADIGAVLSLPLLSPALWCSSPTQSAQQGEGWGCGS